MSHGKGCLCLNLEKILLLKIVLFLSDSGPLLIIPILYSINIMFKMSTIGLIRLGARMNCWTKAWINCNLSLQGIITDYYNETAALPYTLKVVLFVILNGSQKSSCDLKYSIMLMLSKIDEFLMIKS